MKEYSIVFIGTSSGKTSLKRFHSSLLFKSPSFNLLVDCGDGTSRALLSQNICSDQIDGILFSHLHPDHSAGFPSLVVQMKQKKRKKKLKIYCHRNLTETLSKLLHQTFVFTERATFQLEYIEFEHNEKIELDEGFSFTSRQNSHLDKYRKYLGEGATGFSSSSFLMKLNAKSIYYSGDIISADDLYLFENQKPGIVITEAAHVELSAILELIEKTEPEKVYLTHLSEELEIELIKRIEILPTVSREKIILAHDGFSIKIGES